MVGESYSFAKEIVMSLKQSVRRGFTLVELLYRGQLTSSRCANTYDCMDVKCDRAQ